MLFCKQNEEYLPVCHSTNEELQERLKTSGQLIPEGFSIRAGFQTGGKGQKGAVWESEKNKNLLLSFLLRPAFLPASQSFWLSAAMALAVSGALTELGLDTKVKWPNDIWIGSLKIAGMLIENVISGGRVETSIVGIGLNVNQINLPEGATSVAKELGVHHDLELIWEKIKSESERWYFLLAESGWENIRSKYHQKLYKAGMVNVFTKPDGKPFQAIVKGVSPEGRLILIGPGGEQQFDLKEIRF